MRDTDQCTVFEEGGREGGREEIVCITCACMYMGVHIHIHFFSKPLRLL